MTWMKLTTEMETEITEKKAHDMKKVYVNWRHFFHRGKWWQLLQPFVFIVNHSSSNRWRGRVRRCGRCGRCGGVGARSESISSQRTTWSVKKYSILIGRKPAPSIRYRFRESQKIYIFHNLIRRFQSIILKQMKAMVSVPLFPAPPLHPHHINNPIL